MFQNIENNYGRTMMVSKRIKSVLLCKKYYSTALSQKTINGKTFDIDSQTNLSPRVLSLLNINLFKQKQNPICLLKERIVEFFYKKFTNKKGNPLFSVFDDLCPVVTTHQNFDSLLVPKNHPSRSKSDCYYVNKEWLLRAHMTAHQSDLIKMGLNNFLMIGDVYRRDNIDSSHYPVFHQADGVRLFSPQELFAEEDDGLMELSIKKNENCERTKDFQEAYTDVASKKVECELKKTLEDLTSDLFGKDLEYKWVDAYFPFTHPSWELEIKLNGEWMEMLGCGIIEHKILENAGCDNRIGWAFGLGLERLAMAYYSIPDIRIFWSKDPGFLHQFEGKTWADRITFKPFSSYPPCLFDLSFWIDDPTYDCQDFYELAREHCGNIIEQIKLIDVFKHPKTGRESKCYRLVYRSLEKTLSKEECNKIHDELVKKLAGKYNLEIR